MAKKQYPENFKTMFGVTTMWFTQVLGGGLITGYFMLYITDYAGLYTGIAGKAAQVAALMLLIGRIWDAVNDPILGFLMDRSPRTKWGRFKPFIFIATPVSALLLIGLFNIPSGISDIAKVAWLYIFYFLFDSVFTLLPLTPLTQSLSNDARIRAKLTAAPRVATLILSMTTSFFLAIAIALGPDGVTPNMGLAVIAFIVPLALISTIGVAMVKEGTNNADEAKVTLKDLLAMIKTNKPMWIYLIGSLFAGFIWTFMVVAQAYYIKYAFGAENLGTQTAIIGLIMILGLILGTFVSQWVLKIKSMTPGWLYMVAYAVAIVPLAILWLANLAGPITNVAIFYPMMFLAFLGIGMSFVPGRVVSMECMDYNKDKIGKSMEGTLASFFLFTEKLQTAIASAITGIILVAVGYDAELYKDATTIPAELFSGLGFVMFGLPAILGVIAIVIFLFYPLLKQSKRDAMYAEIEARKRAAG